MVGFAAENDDDRDEAFVAPAFGRERYGAGDLERAGHPHHLDLVPLQPERSAGAGDQHVVEMVAEPRFDDQELGERILPQELPRR